jgi:CHAT domain-containing protein/tetratricopeptide (TPR) repeat protein
VVRKLSGLITFASAIWIISVFDSKGTPVSWMTVIEEADKVSVQGHGSPESIKRAQDSAITLANQALQLESVITDASHYSQSYILNHLARYHCLLGNVHTADSLWHCADTYLSATKERSQLRDEILLSLALVTPLLPDPSAHPNDHREALAKMKIVLHWADSSAASLSWLLVNISYRIGLYEHMDRFARNAYFAYSNQGGDAYSAMRGLIHQTEQLSKILNSNTPNTRRLQDSAVLLGQLALQITEKAFGSADTNVAFVFQRLGDYQMRQGDRSGGYASWERAWEINQLALPQEHIEYQGSLNRMATVFRFRGELLKAESMRRLALDLRIKVQGHGHPETAGMYMNLGKLSHEMGKFAEAESCFRAALDIRTHAIEQIPEDIAQCYSQLAAIASNRGQLVEAYENIQKADSTCRTSLDENHLYTLDIRRQMAQLNLDWSNDSAGVIILADLLQRREKFLGHDHPILIGEMFELAKLYAQLRQFRKADTVFSRAVQLAENSIKPQGLALAKYLQDKGDVELCMNRVADAILSLRASLSIIDTTSGVPDHRLLAGLTRLGSALNQADSAESMNIFQRAKELAVSQKNSGIHEVSDALDQVASFFLKHKRTDEAFEMASAAFERRLRVFRNGARMLSELEAVRFQQSVLKSRDLMISSYVHCANQDSSRQRFVTDAIIATKGWVVDDLFWREHILDATADANLKVLMDTLQQFRTYLTKIYTSLDNTNQSTTDAQSLQVASKQVERVEQFIARRSSEYAVERSQADANSESVSSALRPNTAILEYLQYRDYYEKDSSLQYGKLRITSSGVDFVELGSKEAVNRLISKYRDHLDKMLKSPRPPTDTDVKEYRTLGSELSDVLLSKGLSVTKECNTLFISPEAEIHSIAFAGLPDAIGYLIESHAIHYVISSRSVMKSIPASNEGLLSFGDPDFDAQVWDASLASAPVGTGSGQSSRLREPTEDCFSLQSSQLTRLRGSRREVEQVAESWKQRTGQKIQVLMDADATERNLRQYAPFCRVLHIATHAYATDGTCNNASSHLHENYRGSMFSGLFLAGVRQRSPDTRADGILTGTEIATLNLHGVKTVILSGCQTALGIIDAEGSAGLFRSFQIAGVRTVVGSLWPVGDNATAAYVRSLYSQPDLPLPQSMQNAMREQLQQLRKRGQPDHPVLWAAFVATGEWLSLR